MSRGTVMQQSGESQADSALASLPDWSICLGLILAVVAIYARTAGFDFVNYDDAEYVTLNNHVRTGLTPAGIRWAFTGIVSANWMPLTLLSHMLDVQLFGLRAGLHHLTNVLLHAFSAVLLFLCVRRATAHCAAGSRGASVFVAFVFAVHPLHVSSVAWIAERKDVLSTFFGFVALYQYLRYIESRGPMRYLAMTAAFCLGLLSKPMLVTFPFLLLLLDLWPLRRLGPKCSEWRKLLSEKLPLFALSAASAVVTYFVQRSAGAIQPIAPLTRGENAFLSYITYIGQTFWPMRLAVLYPYPKSIPAWRAALAFAVVAAISIIALRSWKKRPWLTAGWFWYAGTLVPVIGFIQVGEQAHADRYMYVPIIGLTIVVAWGALEAIAKWPVLKTPLACAGIASCAACMALAWNEAGYWRNGETLFTRAVAVTENNADALNNLGSVHYSRGDYSGAIAYFEAALRAKPDDLAAHNNLGIAATRAGDYTAAAAHFEAALRGKPDYPQAQNNLALVLFRQGDYASAIPHLEAAIRAEPEYAEAQFNLGMVYSALGNFNDAIPHLEAAIRIQPGYTEARYNLGLASLHTGDLNSADSQFEAALRAEPAHAGANFYLGVTIAKTPGAAPDAEARYRAAMLRNPDDAAAHIGLGGLLAALGRTAEAISQLDAARKIHSDPTLVNLLDALRQGKL